MLTDQNRKATILAYYLSKFDIDAVKQLGYENRTDAISQLSTIVGKENSYIKQRRDEFDVLTGSHRQGYHKRAPVEIVQIFHDDLKNYTFEELTAIVKKLLVDRDQFLITMEQTLEMIKITSTYTEEEIELIINAKDLKAKIIENTRIINNRVFDISIPNKLKELYEFRCQVCGERAVELYDIDISEAHHIEPFALTANNNSNNVMILCPDHHRIIHKAKPVFDREQKIFMYENGKTDRLMYNVHL